MTRPAPVRTGVTFAEYLRLEETNTVKHEYIHAQMFMLAGTSSRHNRLAGRLYARLLGTEAGICQTFFADIKVCTPDPNGARYDPDVLVTCDEDDDDPYIKRKPCLIAKVLFPSTKAVDRGEKLLNYPKLETLQAYVLLSQDLPRGEIYRRLALRAQRGGSDADAAVCGARATTKHA